MATKSIRYTRMYRTCRWRWIRYVHYESTINQTRVLPVISVNDWSARVASRTSRRFVSHARFSQRDSYKTIHLSIVSSIYFLAHGNIDIKMFARLLSSHLFSTWKSFARVEIKNSHWTPLIIPYSPPIGNKPDVRPHFHYKSRIHLVHA